MAATAPLPEPDNDGLRELVRSVFEPGQASRDIAELAYEAASEKQRRQAAIEGLQDFATKMGAEWGRRPVRSGHKNQSGRLRALPSMPGGILNNEVRTNDGTSYLLRDVTVEIAAKLTAEYRDRVNTATAGTKFWKEVHEALRKAGVEKLADLGQERVEAIQQKCGYRV